MRCRFSIAGPAACRNWPLSDWVIRPTRAHRDGGATPRYRSARIIGFPRATTLAGYERYAEATGVDAVSLDTAVPMGWAAEDAGAETGAAGQSGPAGAGGRRRRAGARRRRILRRWPGKPFIFNLGHGVVPETPPEHVAALVERVQEASGEAGGRPVQSGRPGQAGGGAAVSDQSVFRSGHHCAAGASALAAGAADCRPPGAGGPRDLRQDGRRLADPAGDPGPGRGPGHGAGPART